MSLSSLPTGSNVLFFCDDGPRLFPEVLGSQNGCWSWSQGVLKPVPMFSVYSKRFVPFILPRVKLQGKAQKTWIPLSSTSGLESSFLGPWDHCWVLHGCIQSWSKRLLTCHRDKKVQPDAGHGFPGHSQLFHALGSVF